MNESKEKFTPGPWDVYDTRERAEYAYDYYITAGQYFVAAVSADSLNIQEANAALIAAAPEMYEMLDQFRRYIAEGPLGTRGEMYRRIDALLAKARGEVQE